MNCATSSCRPSPSTCSSGGLQTAQRAADDAVHVAHLVGRKRLPPPPQADEFDAFCGREGFLHSSASDRSRQSSTHGPSSGTRHCGRSAPTAAAARADRRAPPPPPPPARAAAGSTAGRAPSCGAPASRPAGRCRRSSRPAPRRGSRRRCPARWSAAASASRCRACASRRRPGSPAAWLRGSTAIERPADSGTPKAPTGPPPVRRRLP